jgi:hypothetical protein
MKPIVCTVVILAVCLIAVARQSFVTNPVLLSNPGPHHFLEVTTTNHGPVMTIDCAVWSYNSYPAPTNAADVKIRLATSDGKTWTCKWVKEEKQ